MLYRPDLVEADPELAEKLKLLPKEDFILGFGNPIGNISMLLEGNPENKKAYEYIMAWFLLEKNIEAVINEAEKINNMSYSKIPKHIEEALILYSMNAGMLPDIAGMKISDELIDHYLKYAIFSDPFMGNQSSGNKDIQEAYRNTYWFYFDSR